MADIQKELNDIKNAVYGKEVRGAIHDGIKKINEEVENATDLSESAKHQVENIQQQVNQLVVEGDSSVEAAQARVDAEGKSFPTLKARLDAKETEFSSQLADNANKIGILSNVVYVESFPIQIPEADDSGRINRAITEAVNSKKGAIFFAAKTYSISSTINIPTGVKLIGVGWERRTGTGLGTVIKRTSNIVAFKSEGVSVLQPSPNHNQNVEFSNIRFEGGNYSADFMQLTACSIVRFNNCQFFGMTGRQLLLTEVMDSEFNFCHFDWGGSDDGTLPAVELTSGGFYEYTNQIRFRGCRWESYRGVALALTGTNTNEIWFTDCKFESANSNKTHIKIYNAVNIYLGGIQITSRGSAGQTIPQIIDIKNTEGVVGYISWEHIGGTNNAQVTNFITADNSSMDLNIFVYNGEDRVTSNYLCDVTNGYLSRQNIRGMIRGTNPTNKRITNRSTPFNVQGLAIRSFGVPQKMMQIPTINDQWYEKVMPDGSYTKVEISRVKSGTETVIYRIDENNDFKVFSNLFLSKGFYLANLSTPPYATKGAMYFDTVANAVKVYDGTTWKTLNWT